MPTPESTSARLTPRGHLAAALDCARLRMLGFLLAARRAGWLSAQHCDDRWGWPSLYAATCALMGVADRPTPELPAPEAIVEALDARIATLQAAVAETLEGGRRLPLVELARAFGLQSFDLEILSLALAAEFDPAFRAGLQLWRRDQSAAAMDVETALLLLGNEPGPAELSYRRAFEPRRPLVAHRLIELAPRAEGLRPLYRAADSVVRFALGDPTVGAEVQRAAHYDERPADPLRGGQPSDPTESYARLLDACRAGPAAAPTAFHLLGPDGSARRSLVQSAVARSGRPLISLNGRMLDAYGSEVGDLLLRIRRDAILTGAVVHLHLPGPDETVRLEDARLPDVPPPPPAAALALVPTGDEARPNRAPPADYVMRAVQHHLALAPQLVVLTGPPGRALFAGSRRLVGGLTRRLDASACDGVLRAFFGQDAERYDLLNEVVGSFSLTTGDLAIACRIAALHTGAERSTDERDGLAAALSRACEARAHAQLTSFAERVRTRAGWDDVVLAEPVTRRLRELASFAAHHHTVFYEWGFDASMPSGRALTALFAGPSGTGKTMVAGVIARQLGRPLYRIDLARVVSKYVGETERQLELVFGEAEREGAVLLFDEADSIFSKRTEVQSANDRYANATVNYLLQRLDAFEGVAILTTNKKDAIDSALRRRIKYRIDFELPDADARETIWQAHIPRRAPVDGAFDLRALARAAELSGANIRNAVLRACLMAANEGVGLSQKLLFAAVERECEDLGKLVRR